MTLNEETYFSHEAEQFYIGHSQFCSFQRCEAAALASIQGKYTEPESTALLVGSYVDAYFSGSLPLFKAQHQDIYKRDGTLKSEYVQAEQIIARIERDSKMMTYMSGEHQVIMTGEIEDVPVEIKMDSYHQHRCICDGKIMRDFAPVWVDGVGKVSFVEAWGYDIQAYFYQTIVEQNTGDRLPFIIAGATKQSTPRIALIGIPQDAIDAAGEVVRGSIGRYAAIKRGEIEPERCEKCDYCAETDVLTGVVDYRDL